MWSELGKGYVGSSFKTFFNPAVLLGIKIAAINSSLTDLCRNSCKNSVKFILPFNFLKIFYYTERLSVPKFCRVNNFLLCLMEDHCSGGILAKLRRILFFHKAWRRCLKPWALLAYMLIYAWYKLLMLLPDRGHRIWWFKIHFLLWYVIKKGYVY